MNISTSEDLPLQLRGGQDEATVIFNRIAVINRINYLVRKIHPSFDLRERTEVYCKCLDLELWKKYYHATPRAVADETFCQRAAGVCVQMEKPDQIAVVDEKEFQKAFKTASAPGIFSHPKKENFLQKIIKKVRGK